MFYTVVSGLLFSPCAAIIAKTKSDSKVWISSLCSYNPDPTRPDSQLRNIQFYINDHYGTVKDINKNDLPSVVNGNEVHVSLQDPDYGIIKAVLNKSGYNSIKIYVDNRQGIQHASGSCVTQKVDACELFPSVCRPADNRGF